MDNKALGKGLAALLPERNMLDDASNQGDTSLVKYVSPAKLRYNTQQPRTHYDEEKLAELKASIQEKGMLQPILVRPSGEGYEVVAGERRLRAAQSLNLKEIPVIIKNVTDKESLVLALIENIQREELNAIEEGQGFRKLIQEFNYSQDEVAKAVGKDRSTITNLMRLLKLPSEIQNGVSESKISMGHARALLSVADPYEQSRIYEQIVAKDLSVREVEKMVKKGTSREDAKPIRDPNSIQHEVRLLEEELQKVLGTKVSIIAKKNKGKIVVEYYSLDDLDRIIASLKK